MRALALLLALIATPAMADDTVYFTAILPPGLTTDVPDGQVVVVAGVPKESLVETHGKRPMRDRECEEGEEPPCQEPTGPKELTDAEYEAIILDQAVLFVANGVEIKCKDVPSCTRMPDDWFPPFDRRLRNAWKQRDKDTPGNFTDMGEPMRGIEIDMGKAKGLWKEKMERAALAEAQDTDDEIRMADIRGDNQAKAAAQQKRNALNGIAQRNQAAIDAAQTPEALMAIWPTELEKRRPTRPDAAEVNSRRSDRAKGLRR